MGPEHSGPQPCPLSAPKPSLAAVRAAMPSGRKRPLFCDDPTGLGQLRTLAPPRSAAARRALPTLTVTLTDRPVRTRTRTGPNPPSVRSVLRSGRPSADEARLRAPSTRSPIERRGAFGSADSADRRRARRDGDRRSPRCRRPVRTRRDLLAAPRRRTPSPSVALPRRLRSATYCRDGPRRIPSAARAASDIFVATSSLRRGSLHARATADRAPRRALRRSSRARAVPPYCIFYEDAHVRRE